MGAETELILPTTKASFDKENAKLSDDKFGINNSEFPAGLRVLVVDDDPICLLILDRMLQRCRYRVTTCGGAVEALRVLRENKDGFDVVISDVHMPDMDGFKLLELIGLEMDLPVIMMSANGETSTVMKGIKHGACDYLLKPVRIEELKNIWQHVVRKKKKDGVDSTEDKRFNDSGENQSNDGPDSSSKQQKKRKEDEDDPEVDNEDPSTSKKPRVVWSVELHQKFVNAVNQLGIDKAVPKRILELMDVRGLTRENVASHLQKYRLYLKRISGVAHQSGCTMLSSPDAGFGITRPSFSDFVSSLQTGSLDRANHNTWPGVAGSDLYKLRQLAALHGNAGGPIVRSPYGLSLTNSSSGLQPSAATGLNVNSVSGIRQSGLFNSSPNASRSGLLDLHQLSSSTTISAISPLVGGLDNNRLSIDNQNNNNSIHSNTDSLILKFLQQKNTARMSCSAADTQITNTCMSDVERLRKAMGLNTGLGVGDLFNHSNTSSNEYNLASREMDADIKNLCAPYNVSSKISPPLALQTTNNVSVKQTVPTVNETLDIAGSRNANSITQKSSIIENAGLLDWQSLVQNQNLGQKAGFGLSSHINQNYGQLHGFRDTLDRKPIAVSMNNQSMQENNLMLKDSSLLDSICDMPKVCDGMVHESFPLLDDTLVSYTKQVQAQVLNQTENNFGIEGYALGNMHVK